MRSAQEGLANLTGATHLRIYTGENNRPLQNRLKELPTGGINFATPDGVVHLQFEVSLDVHRAGLIGSILYDLGIPTTDIDVDPPEDD